MQEVHSRDTELIIFRIVFLHISNRISTYLELLLHKILFHKSGHIIHITTEILDGTHMVIGFEFLPFAFRASLQ